MIENKAYYRFELVHTPNEPVKMALEKIRTQVKIDESNISLFRASKNNVIDT